MKTNKKAQSMSLNVIIVAVLALIVLVVLLYVFSSKINIFGKGVSTCQGTCESGNKDNGYITCENLNQNNPTSLKKYTYNPSGICDAGKICCNQVQIG
jgi:hypothetical protein